MKYAFLIIFAGVFFSCTKTTTEITEAYDSLNYSIYFGDRKEGYQRTWMTSDGSIRSQFEFNDRGRGPRYDETFKADETGSISQLLITGHNYFKDTVTEEFSISNNEATWSSTTETGSASFESKPFYSSYNGSFAANEFLTRKLLNSPDLSVDLLPGGKATLISEDEHVFGDSIQLRLFTITGFSFTPSYSWIDSEGRFFAFVSNWFSCIRDGYYPLIEELRKIQDKKQDQYYENLSELLTEKPSGSVAITNVSLFDAKKGIMIPEQTVIINGNIISATGNSADLEIPGSARIVDGTGKFLMPGLFDNHAHIDKSGGILDLAAGVTSIRDLANSLDLPETKAKFDDGTLLGPRIVTMSGFIDQAGPYAGPTGKIVEDLDAALEAVQFYKDRGYHQIKLYSSIDPSWVKPITEKAHELGLRVSGHIPAHMLASEAVTDGYDEIQHVNMLALNFMSDTIDTRTPLRFTMVAEHAREIDTADAEFKSFVQQLKSEKIVVDPTVSIFDGMLTSKPGEPDPSFKSVIDRFPVQIRRGYYGGGLPIPAERENIYKESYQRLLDIVHALYRSGVVILPGTDATAGFALHTELENYVRAGIPVAEVLKAATITSAMVSKVDDKLGSIEKGKLADLILIDGNPMEDISNIRRVELTIKDGNIYDSKKLYESIGVGFFK